MKNILQLILVTLLLCFGVSCTKNFDEINTDTSRLQKLAPENMPAVFNQGISHAVVYGDRYQAGLNLFADLYAQYWSNVNTSFKSDRFYMNYSWINESFLDYYTVGAPPLTQLLESADPNSAEYALASIMWVYLFHNVTDQYGPVPYFLTLGDGGQYVYYDDQAIIYDDFFKKLDAADKVLKKRMTEKPYGTSDIIYSGNVAKWDKFANSLRLRLALRISKVDPVRAKTEAEAAVAAGVFLKSPEDDALIQRTKAEYDLSHHLSVMSKWGEFAMSATMESYLKGYNDPRMMVWFSPTKSTDVRRTPSYKGQPEYHGVRNGLLSNDFNDAKNKINNNSIPGFRWNLWLNSEASSTSQNIMCTAEAYFLRAEGALNGWNMGGTAKELYESGIKNSFLQWGIATDPGAYIAGTTLPVAPEDYLSSPPAANVPVAFGSTEVIQREQIGTQRWLSTFPDGYEGWASWRRSGYPKLYAVPNSDNADLEPGAVIRRLVFPSSEAINNAKGLETGLILLGGPDKASTRLWWDKQ